MDKIDKFLKDYLDKRRENEGSLQEKEHACPSEETIACYLDNLLNTDERDGVERHLVKCEDCLRQTILLHSIKSETKENSQIETPAVAKTGHGADNRHYPRVNTHIPAKFKYHPGHNGVISGRANIINLSEGGALADRITAVNTTNGETITNPDMSGHELYDMKFKLNGNSELIETTGECVREFRNEDKLSAGLRFKGLKKVYKERIKGFVKNIATQIN